MRYGGVSEGLFESLNGKKGNGDTEGNVDENRLRAAASLCHPALDSKSNCSKDSCLRRKNRLAFITHSFETHINWVTAPGEYSGFDGSITNRKDAILAHATADCGSVVIASTDGMVVALVHGSWHTVKDNIIYDVIKKMKSDTAQDLIAAIGPMICKKCYEFGVEAASLFDSKYLTKTDATYHVDLKQMVKDQLRDAGVISVDDLDVCTMEDERFFSHRRNGAHSGRFLTLATLS